MVMVADCGLHHVTRAADGEWWYIGDSVRTGVSLRLADAALNTFMWMLAHACPFLSTRDADYVGPHAMARIVVCSLVEGAFVGIAALVLPAGDSLAAHKVNASLASQTEAGEDASRIMARWICLPALCVSLVALATFFAAMEPRYRRTFYVRDSRRAMYRRHWAAWVLLGQRGLTGTRTAHYVSGTGLLSDTWASQWCFGSSSMQHTGRSRLPYVVHCPVASSCTRTCAPLACWWRYPGGGCGEQHCCGTRRRRRWSRTAVRRDEGAGSGHAPR
jgi:hypothetical protein